MDTTANDLQTITRLQPIMLLSLHTTALSPKEQKEFSRLVHKIALKAENVASPPKRRKKAVTSPPDATLIAANKDQAQFFAQCSSLQENAKQNMIQWKGPTGALLVAENIQNINKETVTDEKTGRHHIHLSHILSNSPSTHHCPSNSSNTNSHLLQRVCLWTNIGTHLHVVVEGFEAR